MNDRQRYYASLERQKTAEMSLRNPSPASHSTDVLEELYADMGMRAFAAFQNCLDWVANLGRRSAQDETAQSQDHTGQGIGESTDLAETLQGIQEQLERLETAMNNLESGMRRIDKYTLDAFRQLAELDAARTTVETPSEAAGPRATGRRLAKEEAIRLAMAAAERMVAGGRPLSLAAVAREAGLKYGQIVYAFGNKENFLEELARFKDSSITVKDQVSTEVAASEDGATA